MLVVAINGMSSELIVYKTVGVIRKKVSTLWNVLDKQAIVNDADTIQIGKGSSLSILDKVENRVYIYDVEGEWLISDIVKRCKKDNLNVTNRMISEAKKQISRGQQKSYVALGGVKRDVCDEEVIENIYSQLCTYVASSNIVQSSSTMLKRIQNVDRTFYFEISNNEEIPIYANILYRPNQTGSWRILYKCSSDYPCLEIPTGSTIEMKHERMIDEKGCYILFSTNILFDSSELDYMFKEKMEPEEINPELQLVRISTLSE